MGDRPDEPVDFVDGGFDNPPDWRLSPNWDVAGSKAIHDVVAGVQNWFGQFFLSFIAGNVYEIEFTASNINLINPAAYIELSLPAADDTYQFTANGVHTHSFFCTETYDGDGIIAFEGWNQTIGDYLELDDMIITNNGSYLSTELGFNLAGTTRSEFYAAAAADYWQILASRQDNSNVLILFDK